jgi:murein DD-endopeptidase MepM/ murein hydrolase activator NlpD
MKLRKYLYLLGIIHFWKKSVIPVKTGIQGIFNYVLKAFWIPAYAGMTRVIAFKKVYLPKVNAPYLPFLTVIIALLIAIATPAIAPQVQINPKNPRLGDAISVLIEEETTNNQAPQISADNKTYPTFPIDNNHFRGFIPSSPLEKARTLQVKIIQGEDVETLPINLGKRSFPVQRITLPPGKAGVNATELELRRAKEFKALITPEKYWQGEFIAPNKGRLSTGYGVRRYYNGEFAQDYYHRGVDYAGGYGSPVIAPAAGKVVLVGKEKEGFRVHGNVIGIDHGQGVVSIFMHLSKINVQEGDFVPQGKVIGAIGSTGASTGPHLHWGLYVNGISVDPARWRSQSVE